MRVFLAGASGVIGVRLVPLLASAGHVVGAMTRSPEKVDRLRQLGGEPIVCDVFDRDELDEGVRGFRPDVVMHQLTDLPDDRGALPDFSERNDRIRSEGTRNLVGAAQAAGVSRFIAQSIAWQQPTESRRLVIETHERMVLEADGVVVRYGQFYGAGTFYPDERPPQPRIEIESAAVRTVAILEVPTGIVIISE
jgi:nucleoside-diphosphate-sugar epimerase